MSFYGLLQKVRSELSFQTEQMPEVWIPQFVKDNVYLTVLGGMALVKGPKALLLGAVSALFCRLVQNGSISWLHKPLVERFLTVIQPALDHPITVADMVAFSALMMFDCFVPLTSWWIGLVATLLIFPILSSVNSQ